jgi:hypothetical protein
LSLLKVGFIKGSLHILQIANDDAVDKKNVPMTNFKA